MTDSALARQMMVDGQVRPADVTDLRLISAMLATPREAYLPPESAGLAYLDLNLPMPGAADRCMLRPALLAKMIQALDLVETDRVLDVGGLGGYGAALLAALAGSVVALEDSAPLAQAAQANFAREGIAATAQHGVLARGWPAGAPYDAILVEGAVEVEPTDLLEQLADGGRLVCIVGRGQSAKVKLYRSVGGIASARPIFDAAAPILPGFAKEPAFVF